MRGPAPEVIIQVGWKVNEEDNLVEASNKELLQEVDVPLVVDHEVTDLVQEGDSIWIKEGGPSGIKEIIEIHRSSKFEEVRLIFSHGVGSLTEGFCCPLFSLGITILLRPILDPKQSGVPRTRKALSAQRREERRRSMQGGKASDDSLHFGLPPIATCLECCLTLAIFSAGFESNCQMSFADRLRRLA
ncbi:hypothetical protein B296_00007450 [Ensete ventricosum]|uniref:Uncharacterized protein n=1 Tax=Ensete ventricosum TaxID=4639 RepID=A0A427B323_ENSVE|nr:hypothetical protein B296_00007450 [Ensete ventricosum]